MIDECFWVFHVVAHFTKIRCGLLVHQAFHFLQEDHWYQVFPANKQNNIVWPLQKWLWESSSHVILVFKGIHVIISIFLGYRMFALFKLMTDTGWLCLTNMGSYLYFCFCIYSVHMEFQRFSSFLITLCVHSRTAIEENTINILFQNGKKDYKLSFRWTCSRGTNILKFIYSTKIGLKGKYGILTDNNIQRISSYL